MKLYTNVMPFSFGWGKDNKPEFEEVGTTFAAIGADFNGILVQLVSKLNSDEPKDKIHPCSVSPSLFKLVLKEVDQLSAPRPPKVI